MADYRGPERRTAITFTREDSDRLVRLEGKVDGFFDKLKEHMEQEAGLLQAQNERHDKNEKRLTNLEKVQNWMMGVGAAITFIISTAIFLFSDHK